MSEDSKPNDVLDAPPEGTTRKRLRSDGRRSELAQIASRLIAENGLEGFRTRQVAAAAGIDTGTLHYYYPSKESLIQAVVDHLVADFQVNRAEFGTKPVNALNELRREVHDVALRVKHSPQQFRVLIDLRLHATRNPLVAEILAKQDRYFHSFLTSLLSRGIKQGIFRPDVDLELAAVVLRTELIGLSFMALLTPERIEEIASALCHQMETWLLVAPKAHGQREKPNQHS